MFRLQWSTNIHTPAITRSDDIFRRKLHFFFFLDLSIVPINTVTDEISENRYKFVMKFT